LTPEYNSLVFRDGSLELQQSYWDLIRAVFSVFHKEGYVWQFKTTTLVRDKQVPTDADGHSIVFSHLIHMFEFVGIPLVKKQERPNNRGNKRVFMRLRIDQQRFDLHLALLGYNIHTLEKLAPREALACFREKYPDF
jgi:hypothetical protein